MSFNSFLIRCLSFSFITITWYFSLLLLAVPLTIWHLYQFRAYEFIFLGVLLDLYFLALPAIPYYTIGFLLAISFMQLLKPSLRNKDMI